PPDQIHQSMLQDPAKPDPKVFGVCSIEGRKSPMRLEQCLLHEVGVVVLSTQIVRQPVPRHGPQVRPERLEETSEHLGIPPRAPANNDSKTDEDGACPTASTCPIPTSFHVVEVRPDGSSDELSSRSKVVASKNADEKSGIFVRSREKMRTQS